MLENVIIYKLFYFILIYFIFILFYFIIITVIIVIMRCYVWFFDGNEPIVFILNLLNIFKYITVADGIVTRSDVIDQLFNILLFMLARCYAINFVLVLDVNE